MTLQPLTLRDKELVEGYLKKSPHALAAYAFENIIVWRPLFKITRVVIDASLCIFFENDAGRFLCLPPLGQAGPGPLSAVFEILEEANHNPDVSRIENVETGALESFTRAGCRFFQKSVDYVVRRDAVAAYRGDGFKDKRHLRNFFAKNFNSEWRDYRLEDRDEVLRLSSAWACARRQNSADPIYAAMLDDSQRVLEALLEDWGSLRMRGRVVVCEGRIRGFTCGFEIAPETFCVNFEIADLAFKGIAQALFSDFARALAPYQEINIMDDSGFENLRRTKESFHPVRRVTSYTVLRSS
jgi:hypothetical protein